MISKVASSSQPSLAFGLDCGLSLSFSSYHPCLLNPPSRDFRLLLQLSGASVTPIVSFVIGAPGDGFGASLPHWCKMLLLLLPPFHWGLSGWAGGRRAVPKLVGLVCNIRWASEKFPRTKMCKWQLTDLTTTQSSGLFLGLWL